MQLVANQQLVKNRVRLGVGFHVTALAVFAVGLALSLQTDTTRELPLASWAAIMVGLLLYTLGQTQLRRWGPRNRQDEPLVKAIRGLDDRYKLYAFLSSSLPDYILVTPAGVHVLVVRNEAGPISCGRDRWTKPGGRLTALLGPGLGNPSADAARDLDRVRKLLAEAGLQDVPSTAFIVFTNDKVQLRIEGCTVTASRLDQFQDRLLKLVGKGKNVALGTARVREVQRVFDERMHAARSWR